MADSSEAATQHVLPTYRSHSQALVLDKTLDFIFIVCSEPVRDILRSKLIWTKSNDRQLHLFCTKMQFSAHIEFAGSNCTFGAYYHLNLR